MFIFVTYSQKLQELMSLEYKYLSLQMLDFIRYVISEHGQVIRVYAINIDCMFIYCMFIHCLKR